jgi:endonuclease/exonuclease/phosphatase family metal-dependent hydrolase
MPTKVRSLVVALAAFALACGSAADGSTNVAEGPSADAPPAAAPAAAPPPDGTGPAPAPAPAPAPDPLKLVAMTFNTGMHDQNPNDDFSASNAKIVETYYGSGLAWNTAIDATKTWMAGVAPDVVGLQEIFDPEECPTVPLDKRHGFVCETVAQTILGAGYQIACHPGHHDICLGVKLSFGKFQGCTGAVCPDGLVGGAKIPTCGSGARIARGVVELVSGGTLTVVSVHASSGSTADNAACRSKQFDQIFTNLDGAPAANGTRNVILGDFNTDPGRLAAVDASAKTLDDYTGSGTPFHFVTDVGSTVAPTYLQTLVPLLPVGLNIDHVLSDKLKGSCWTAGVTSGHPPVASTDYFDHKPGVCTLSE